MNVAHAGLRPPPRPDAPHRPAPAPGGAALRRLSNLRWIAIGLQLALLATADGVLGIRLHLTPMLAVLVLLTAFNLITLARMRRGQPAGERELLLQIAVDVAALTVFTYVAGGVTNPLISMYLPLIAVAATLLPGRLVALIVLACVAAYSLLTFAYLPFELHRPEDAVRLHLFGMWLTFAVSAFVIGWFVVRMTRTIRARDAELAGAREAALRNERVIALGNLAAGAAHELGTPLGTIAIVSGELLQRPGLAADVREELELVRDQVAQCKSILTGLSTRAGSSRAEGGQALALDAWLGALVDRWHELRPKVSPDVRIGGEGRPPRVAADATLEQALLNLFNNAADASPASVQIDARWDAQALTLAVADRGPGIPAELAGRLGREPVESGSEGSGIGVMLAYAAIERSGGTIAFRARPGGGTVAEVRLPLAAIRVD